MFLWTPKLTISLVSSTKDRPQLLSFFPIQKESVWIIDCFQLKNADLALVDWVCTCDGIMKHQRHVQDMSVLCDRVSTYSFFLLNHLWESDQIL